MTTYFGGLKTPEMRDFQAFPGSNPYATQMGQYENGTYSFPVKTLSQPERLFAQNFDRQRQAALGTVSAGVQSGTKTAMSSLAGSTGLSAADRKALEEQGQRQRVNLSQGALSPYDQMAAQNLYDTDKFNAGQSQSVLDINQQILNDRARDMAVENEKRSVSIYQQRLREALLERQLEAAREIAKRQGA